MAQSEKDGLRSNRRDHIVDHAIAVFARSGFSASSIHDVAVSAGMATTAVYYHFSSKDELYDAALAKVLDQMDEIVERARPSGPGDQNSIVKVLAAVWDWVEDNSASAQLLYHQLPGATAGALKLRSEFEERHISRAVDYLPTPPEPTDKREAAARWATLSLATRTTVSLGMTIHAMRMGDGPLAGESADELRTAYLDTSARVIQAASERILAAAG
jgi:AcrR family transcriptional regulator